MELILENVRCFAGRHEIPIRPLTLLLGENSTGKTTVLATLAVVSDILRFPLTCRFNDPPFSLGTFDTIATLRGGRGGRCRTFCIGCSERDWSVVATFAARDGQPSLACLEVTEGVSQISMRYPDGQDANITIRSESGEQTIEEPLHSGRYMPLDFLLDMIARTASETSPAATGTAPKSSRLGRHPWRRMLPSRAIAPVRTKPRRTYDEFVEEFSPEGDHIPLVLSANESDEAFVTALNDFGTESGLYSEISVKRLGRRPGDPVQLLVRTGGPKANLVDVGYGVSQALPVIVEAIRVRNPTRFLLQQPEVHLHPRAQAALGTFFVQVMQQRKHQFVIETHSDYIVDRIRLEIARGRISPADVALLWFDRGGSETQVHRIELDANGNIVNAPHGYRKFFMEEEVALLTKGSRSE